MPNLGPTELIIILIIVLLLFGGSRLAGLGKSTGRALKEFKEETKGLKKPEDESTAAPRDAQPQIQPQSAPPAQPYNAQPYNAQPYGAQSHVNEPAPSETRRDV